MFAFPPKWVSVEGGNANMEATRQAFALAFVVPLPFHNKELKQLLNP